ncbi:MAG: DsbA family protein [Cyanobacteria bacterium J06623_5]
MELMPKLRDVDHAQGPLSAELLMMAYGSYQCPQSGKAQKVVNKLRSSLGDHLCFVYRHFPTPDYPRSQRAAEAAEAAGRQNKFWEMHNKLFENQNALDDASLVEYAGELGLEISELIHDLIEGVHQERIQSDIDSGLDYGVKETPTFFIGVRHQGSDNLESLVKRLLLAALAEE